MKAEKHFKKGLTTKQKLRLTYLFAGIMCIGLLAFSIFTPKFGKNGGIKDPKATPTPAVTPTATGTPSPSPTSTPTPTPIIPLVKNEDKELLDIVTRYYKAKLSGNKEDLLGIVSDYDSIDYEYIQTYYQYVLDFENFNIYTVEGREGSELKYVLFASYDMSVLTIEDTPVPELTRYVIVESEPDENGKTHPVIHSGILNETQSAYVSEIMDHADVQKLLVDAQQRLLDAVEEDESLKTILEKLHPTPTPTPEPTATPEPTPTPEPTATPGPTATPTPKP